MIYKVTLTCGDDGTPKEWYFSDPNLADKTIRQLEDVYVKTRHNYSCSDYHVNIDTIFDSPPERYDLYAYKIEAFFPTENVDEFHAEIVDVFACAVMSDMESSIKKAFHGHGNPYVFAIVLAIANNASDAINKAKDLCSKNIDMFSGLKEGDEINN